MAFDTDAARPLFKAYFDEIRSLAIEYAGRPEEEREDWLAETIDGHEWIIYTWKARCVMVCTDNPDAYEEDFGEPAPKVEAAACAAMMRDVREAAGRIAP